MKNLIAIILLILFCLENLSAGAQTPTQVIWYAGSEKVTLKTAKSEGVKLPETLAVVANFSKSEIAKIGENVEFEIKWYFYMSTKKTLMGTNRLTVSASQASSDGYVELRGERKNTRKGWWEVQIKCKQTDAQIAFAGEKEYQILLK